MHTQQGAYPQSIFFWIPDLSRFASFVRNDVFFQLRHGLLRRNDGVMAYRACTGSDVQRLAHESGEEKSNLREKQ